jgi:hypothetical protein
MGADRRDRLSGDSFFVDEHDVVDQVLQSPAPVQLQTARLGLAGEFERYRDPGVARARALGSGNGDSPKAIGRTRRRGCSRSTLEIAGGHWRVDGAAGLRAVNAHL